MTEILFRVDCTATTGFGHLARSIDIATAIRSRAPDTSLAFQGALDEKACGVLRRELPCATVRDGLSPAKADVTVIDRLADPEEPDSWDERLFDDVRGSSRAVVAILSGQVDPFGDTDAGPSVRRIGYQPGRTEPSPPHRLWGLEFAPGAPNDLPPDAEIDPDGSERALIALGGAATALNIRRCLDALSQVPAVRAVDVLVSPMTLSVMSTADQTTSGVEWHTDGAKRFDLARQAGLVVTSFGNFGYECLSLGRPVCFVAARPFQERLAAELDELGLAVNAGLFDDVDVPGLSASMIRAQAETDRPLGAKALIDGKATSRYADVVMQLAAT